MQGEVRADFTSMPVSNMITLFAGFAVLLIVAGILIVAIVRKLGIKSFGPFKMEHNNIATMYDMNEKIKGLDDLCHRQMRYITDRMKIHISNIFTEINIWNVESHIMDPYHGAREEFPHMHVTLNADEVSLAKRNEDGFYYNGSLSWQEAR